MLLLERVDGLNERDGADCELPKLCDLELLLGVNVRLGELGIPELPKEREELGCVTVARVLLCGKLRLPKERERLCMLSLSIERVLFCE